MIDTETWDFWRFAAAVAIFALWFGAWHALKIAHHLEDLVDVFYDDADEECRATLRLPGTAAVGQPGHLHSCDLTHGHDGQHHCPACTFSWTGWRQGGGRVQAGPQIVDQDGGA